LANAPGIDQQQGQPIRQPRAQLNLLATRRGAQEMHGALGQGIDIHVVQFELQLAGANPREIEQIVDHRQ
jgi:hypothetical protein